MLCVHRWISWPPSCRRSAPPPRRTRAPGSRWSARTRSWRPSSWRWRTRSSPSSNPPSLLWRLKWHSWRSSWSRRAGQGQTLCLMKMYFFLYRTVLLGSNVIVHLRKFSTDNFYQNSSLNSPFVFFQGQAGICQEFTPEGQEAQGPDYAGGRRKETGRAVQRPGRLA